MDHSPPGSSVHGDSPGKNTGGGCHAPGDLFNPGIKPRSPTLQTDSLSSEPPGKPINVYTHTQIYTYHVHQSIWLSTHPPAYLPSTYTYICVHVPRYVYMYIHLMFIGILNILLSLHNIEKGICVPLTKDDIKWEVQGNAIGILLK